MYKVRKVSQRSDNENKGTMTMVTGCHYVRSQWSPNDLWLCKFLSNNCFSSSSSQRIILSTLEKIGLQYLVLVLLPSITCCFTTTKKLVINILMPSARCCSYVDSFSYKLRLIMVTGKKLTNILCLEFFFIIWYQNVEFFTITNRLYS